MYILSSSIHTFTSSLHFQPVKSHQLPLSSTMAIYPDEVLEGNLAGAKLQFQGLLKLPGRAPQTLHF